MLPCRCHDCLLQELIRKLKNTTGSPAWFDCHGNFKESDYLAHYVDGASGGVPVEYTLIAMQCSIPAWFAPGSGQGGQATNNLKLGLTRDSVCSALFMDSERRAS